MRIDLDTIRREQATLLRSRGLSLGKTAEIAGLPKSTVRYITRDIKPAESADHLQDEMAKGERCLFCGAPLEHAVGKGRPRRFCSDHCRRQYWRLHRSEQKRDPKRVFTKLCRYCGQPFEVYGKSDQKYCCREHYIQHYYGDSSLSDLPEMAG